MPKPIQARCHKVILTDHAYQRFCERSRYMRRSKLAALMTARINAELGRGLYLDKSGAGWVDVCDLWATVGLTDEGWVVVTFRERGKNEGVV